MQLVAYYLAHPSSVRVSIAAGEDRRTVRADARRRLRASGIAKGRLIVRARNDLDADAFGELCLHIARSFAGQKKGAGPVD